jgi:hypothetical protein
VSERILKGPFLTRAEAARRADVPAGLVAYRPDLLRVEGKWLQEAYFGFQFDPSGVRQDLGAVVQELKREYSDIEIADWLVRPNQVLGYSSPLKHVSTFGVDRVLAAAEVAGPTSDAPIESLPDVDRDLLRGSPTDRRPTVRRSRHGRPAPRPAFGSR